MARLPYQETTAAWAALQWATGKLVSTNSRTKPLTVIEAPRVPGLYRMTWTGLDDWANIERTLVVKASVKVDDPKLDFSDRTPPVLLTIGRTTNIYNRLRQHFSTNRHSNRVLSRLRQLSALPLEDLLDLIRKNIKTEWVAVPGWIERCLLEKFGVVTEWPVLDLEAEH
ncbi:MAG TPA: hypothetical protein VG097_04250 [Gemmata sp.]|nr:hypothetical protein [Gemmata sp.]